MGNWPRGVPEPSISDAAKRASDIINSYRTFVPWDELKTKWVAIRLEDGGHDGTLYDSKRDAVRHQSYEQQCAYVAFTNLVGGSNPREMAAFLLFNRKAYDAGMRLADPDSQTGGLDLAITTNRWDDFRTRMLPKLGR